MTAAPALLGAAMLVTGLLRAPWAYGRGLAAAIVLSGTGALMLGWTLA
jgi:hypothetical protein